MSGTIQPLDASASTAEGREGMVAGSGCTGVGAVVREHGAGGKEPVAQSETDIAALGQG